MDTEARRPTWKELNARVEQAGLGDLPVDALHVVIDGPDWEDDVSSIEVFKNANGGLSVVNSCCR